MGSLELRTRGRERAGSPPLRWTPKILSLAYQGLRRGLAGRIRGRLLSGFLGLLGPGQAFFSARTASMAVDDIGRKMFPRLPPVCNLETKGTPACDR